MSWKADQIYAKPNPKLIQYLSSIEGFADELFLVNDLDGIRSEFTNNVIFSDDENEFNHQQHSLPNMKKTKTDDNKQFNDDRKIRNTIANSLSEILPTTPSKFQ